MPVEGLDPYSALVPLEPRPEEAPPQPEATPPAPRTPAEQAPPPQPVSPEGTGRYIDTYA